LRDVVIVAVPSRPLFFPRLSAAAEMFGDEFFDPAVEVEIIFWY